MCNKTFRASGAENVLVIMPDNVGKMAVKNPPFLDSTVILAYNTFPN